jgi:hypothetical protein
MGITKRKQNLHRKRSKSSSDFLHIEVLMNIPGIQDLKSQNSLILGKIDLDRRSREGTRSTETWIIFNSGGRENQWSLAVQRAGGQP